MSLPQQSWSATPSDKIATGTSFPRGGQRSPHTPRGQSSPLLPREQVAGGMVPKYLVERIEAILRGSPLPARRSEREQVRGRLVRAR